MGIPLWESPPNASTLDKASATNRCEIHSITTSSSSGIPVGGSSSSSSGTRERERERERDRSGSSLPYDYIYSSSSSRPHRRQHFLDTINSSSEPLEVDDLHNEREHETQIRERERERDRDRDRDQARLDRRRERAAAAVTAAYAGADRRPSHTDRFLNANYPTPPLPTTSTSSLQRTRPHMIQPATENVLATVLNDFLRENPPTYTRSSNNSSGAGNGSGGNTSTLSPSAETSALHHWLGLRGPSSSSNTATRTTSERRDPSWERALSSLPTTTLTPATTAVSTSNTSAAATISTPSRRLPVIPPVPTAEPSRQPPTSTATNSSTTGTSGDNFHTLLSQIRRIGALQDYMLNSVDETATSLEESLSLHSQALSRAAATTSAQRELHLMTPGTLDIQAQNYYTSLRVREARIRGMQSRIEVLAGEFAALRTSRRELRRMEAEGLSLGLALGAGGSGLDIPTTTTITSTTAPSTNSLFGGLAGNSSTTAISAPINISSTPTTGRTDSFLPHQQRTEVDEVHDALDAEGNSTHRRFLRSSFLPALDVENSREDALILQHLERAEERARLRERERLGRLRGEVSGGGFVGIGAMGASLSGGGLGGGGGMGEGRGGD